MPNHEPAKLVVQNEDLKTVLISVGLTTIGQNLTKKKHQDLSKSRKTIGYIRSTSVCEFESYLGKFDNILLLFTTWLIWAATMSLILWIIVTFILIYWVTCIKSYFISNDYYHVAIKIYHMHSEYSETNDISNYNINVMIVLHEKNYRSFDGSSHCVIALV